MTDYAGQYTDAKVEIYRLRRWLERWSGARIAQLPVGGTDGPTREYRLIDPDEIDAALWGKDSPKE